MLFFLILLCLILLGVAGLQFSYMFYMDRMDRERKKRLNDLEKHCKTLKQRLAVSESRLREKEALLLNLGTNEETDLSESELEMWDDILEDE